MTDRPLTYLRSAIRSLRRTPGLSLAAIASLALGIGANAAIFAAFNQSLLKRLPIQRPEQLVTLSAPGDKNGRVSASNSGRAEAVFSYPLFRDLERGQQIVHRSCRASRRAGECRAPRTDLERARLARLGQLLSRARRAAGAGPLAVGCRRPDHRRASRRRAEPRLLALAVRERSVDSERHDHHQRRADDRRRRGATGLPWHDAGGLAGSVRAAHDERRRSTPTTTISRTAATTGST